MVELRWSHGWSKWEFRSVSAVRLDWRSTTTPTWGFALVKQPIQDPAGAEPGLLTDEDKNVRRMEEKLDWGLWPGFFDH